MRGKRARKTLPIVEIEWNDAASILGWYGVDRMADLTLSECVSVGYLLRKTKEKIVIAGSVDEGDLVNRCQVVPMSEVTRIRVLRRGR